MKIAALLAFFAASALQIQAQEPTPIGRFQIYAAAFYDQHERKEAKGLFKIDTMTGRTWQYQVFTVKADPKSQLNGSTVSGWVLVDDDPLQTINKLPKG